MRHTYTHHMRMCTKHTHTHTLRTRTHKHNACTHTHTHTLLSCSYSFASCGLLLYYWSSWLVNIFFVLKFKVASVNYGDDSMEGTGPWISCSCAHLVMSHLFLYESQQRWYHILPWNQQAVSHNIYLKGLGEVRKIIYGSYKHTSIKLSFINFNCSYTSL